MLSSFLLLLVEEGEEICIKHAVAHSPHPCTHTCANTRENGGVPTITWISGFVPDVIKGEVMNCRAV